MNDRDLMLADAIWVAKALFDRNKVTGSSANLSFRHGDRIYITGSGTCFGRLQPESFAAVDLDGRPAGGSGNPAQPGALPNAASGIAPSKELPLHLMLYQARANVQAVIHTHSFHATLWSCLPDLDPDDAVPEITPYLRMKVGRIALVPYAKPGSEALFGLMRSRLGAGDGFILAKHGPVIAGSTVMEAFHGLEELEDSAKIAWFLRQAGQ